MVILSLAAHQLDEMGYRMKSAQGLKPKHIEALVTRWKQEGLSTGTLKNRMSALRWLAEKIDKRSIIARSNDHYGIADRVLVTNVSKARELREEALAKVTCPMTRMSLRLQEAFGLRREESIKIRPHLADRGDRLVLLASWTKGGRERWIPFRTPEQRALLDEAKQFARQTKLGSLIERGTYKEQLNAFVYQCQRAGIHQVHGHRHLYAQRRYQSLTGWLCPAAGGPRSRQLSPGQREIDRRARVIVSAELGHGREQVTAVYLGR
jgi:site-specific recombinase XerC